MACFNPFYVRYIDGQFGRFGGKLTQAVIDSALPGETIVPVPCGKCDGCRLDRSKAWADRMLAEYEYPVSPECRRKALFITLTYDDAHLPLVTCTDRQRRGTLKQRDTQLFLKRLRKHFVPRKLRYFVCGEYGGTTFRPHYHMILFGLGLDDLGQPQVFSQGEQPGTINYTSDLLLQLWQNGLAVYSDVNYQTFAYVARYVLKKQFGSDDGALFYKGRVPPFCSMSRRPGLGAVAFSDLDDDFTRSIPINGTVRLVGSPRAFRLKLKDTDPELYDNMAASRRLASADRQRLRDSLTDLTFLQQRQLDGAALKAKTKLLHKRKN